MHNEGRGHGALTRKEVIVAVSISLAITLAAALLVGSGVHRGQSETVKPEHHDKRGFTLIEMSIVLVVIGLIVGGVLVGQSLIKASQLRSVVSQLERYNSAVNTFRGKYDCLPGDCPTAVSFGLGTAGGAGDNGDGNGTIHSYGWMFGSQWPQQKESLNAWYHLSQAGLIEGGYQGYHAAQPTSMTGYLPVTALGSNAYVSMYALAFDTNGDFSWGQNLWASNGFYIAGVDLVGGGYASALTPADAFAIDTKIDDGNPVLGNVVAGYQYYSGPLMATAIPPGWVVAACGTGTGSSAKYATSNTVGCVLGIKAQF